MFSFIEDNQLKYAPGRPIAFDFRANELYITIQWLNTTLPNLHVVQDIDQLLLEELSSLPLSSFCASLAHLPIKIQERYMTDYFTPLRLLREFSSKPALLEWSLSRGYPQDENQLFDMQDLLEFRFVKSTWIWRTTLGLKIWTDYIQPFLTFGNAPNLSLVTKLLNAPRFLSTEPTQFFQRIDCDACKKPQIVEHQVNIGEVFSVGIACYEHMEYIYDVGYHMSQMRLEHSVDPHHQYQFLQTLTKLQSAYLETRKAMETQFAR